MVNFSLLLFNCYNEHFLILSCSEKEIIDSQERSHTVIINTLYSYSMYTDCRNLVLTGDLGIYGP